MLAKQKFGIYPNPTSDYLKLDTDRKIELVEVYDLSGKQVLVKLENNTMNVSMLAKGIYILKFKLDGENFTEKFIKNLIFMNLFIQNFE